MCCIHVQHYLLNPGISQMLEIMYTDPCLMHRHAQAYLSSGAIIAPWGWYSQYRMCFAHAAPNCSLGNTLMHGPKCCKVCMQLYMSCGWMHDDTRSSEWCWISFTIILTCTVLHACAGVCIVPIDVCNLGVHICHFKQHAEQWWMMANPWNDYPSVSSQLQSVLCCMHVQVY